MGNSKYDQKEKGAGLPYWRWPKFQGALKAWTISLLGRRLYTVKMNTRGQQSYMSFDRRLIVIAPELASTMKPESVTLPTRWGKTNVETTDQLNALFARYLLAHECGHVLYTASNARIKGGYHMMLMNILEDQRIELLVGWTSGRRWRDIREAGHRTWLGGCTLDQDRTTNFMNACLYARYNELEPGGDQKEYTFPDPKDTDLFYDRVLPLCMDAWEAESTHDVARIALDILNILDIDPEYKAPEQGKIEIAIAGKAPEGQRQPGDELEDHPLIGVSAQSEEGENGHGAEGKQASKDGQGKQDKSGSEPGAGQPEDPGKDPQEGAGEGAGGEDDGTPGGSGDEAASGEGGQLKRKGRFVPLPDAGPDSTELEPYVGKSEPDCDPSGGDLWMVPYEDILREVAGATRKLIEALKLPQPDAEDEYNNKTGLVSTRAIVATRGQRPFLRPDEEGMGHDGLAIWLGFDGTGSTGCTPYQDSVQDLERLLTDESWNNKEYPAYHMRRAGLLFQNACAEAGIPLSIGHVVSSSCYVHYKDGDRRYRSHYPPVAFIQRFSDNPRAEGPRALMAGIYGNGSGESVSAGMEVGARELRTLPGAMRRVIIALHDGQPTDERPHQVKANVERLRKEGFTVIGVFLGTGAGADRMVEMFGKHAIIVSDFSRLPMRLSTLLQGLRNGE